MGRYKPTKLPEKINHQTIMDDIKVFTKNDKEPLFLQTIRIYSQHIGIEFGAGKCVILVMKKKKKKRNKYLLILEANGIKRMKKKSNKRLSQKNEKTNSVIETLLKE